MGDSNKDYWNSYDEAKSDSVGESLLKDVGEGFIEGVTFGLLSSRNDDERAGREDGKASKHG